MGLKGRERHQGTMRHKCVHVGYYPASPGEVWQRRVLVVVGNDSGARKLADAKLVLREGELVAHIIGGSTVMLNQLTIHLTSRIFKETA